MAPYDNPDVDAEAGQDPVAVESEDWALYEGKELSHEIFKRITQFYDDCEANQFINRWISMVTNYYGYDNEGHQSNEITVYGKRGEILTVKVNVLRNLLKHVLTSVVKDRPAYDVHAVNEDSVNIEASQLGADLLEYETREKGLEQLFKTAGERAHLAGGGFLHVLWDFGDGPIDRQGNATGDFRVDALYPWDVPRDIMVPRQRQLWKVAISRESIYDLKVRYPEKANEIKDYVPERLSNLRDSIAPYLRKRELSDQVHVYHFYRVPSPSCPLGRYVKLVNKDCILLTNDFPYERLPVVRCSAGEFADTDLDYSDFFETIALQKILDSTMSAILSRTQNGAHPAVSTGLNSRYPTRRLGQYRVIEVPEGGRDPQIVDLLSLPDGLFRVAQLCEQQMESLVGTNAVMRGNPQAALGKGASGQFAALVAEQAISFSSGFEESYHTMVQDAGKVILGLIQAFAPEDRIYKITGTRDRHKIKSFTKRELGGVSQVYVESSDRMMRTVAGRMEAVHLMSQLKIPLDANAAYDLITAGKWEPMTEKVAVQRTLIQSENEMLADPAAPAPIATIADSHLEHIMSHAIVIESPNNRYNAQVVQKATAHIQEHMNIWRSSPPELLAMFGQKPLGMPAPDGPPPGPGGPPPSESPDAPSPSPAKPPTEGPLP